MTTNLRSVLKMPSHILLDVIDTRTNELVDRNHVKGDVVRSASDATRANRIDAAVGQALESFCSRN